MSDRTVDTDAVVFEDAISALECGPRKPMSKETWARMKERANRDSAIDRQCCENGNFGDGHECMKQNPDSTIATDADLQPALVITEAEMLSVMSRYTVDVYGGFDHHFSERAKQAMRRALMVINVEVK